ncbi:hypothetical protein GOODEAATRI_019246, partial [Goodea atripinnis]
EDNGMPVHLKGGSTDALLYRATMALTVLGEKNALSSPGRKFNPRRTDRPSAERNAENYGKVSVSLPALSEVTHHFLARLRVVRAGGAGSSPLLSSRPRGNSSHLEGGSPTRLGTSRTHGDLGLQHWTTSRSVRLKPRLHRGFNCFILIVLNTFQQFSPQLLACTAEAEWLKMKSRLSLAASALLALLALVLLSSSQAQDQVDAPTDLRFKILNENTVQMIWSRPLSRIQGYRIQVTSDTGEQTRQFSLPASATKTSISDLSPDVDYEVTIVAYAGSEESLPMSGQITLESSSSSRGGTRKPNSSDSVRCPATAVADVLFLVDGSWSVGRPNFKYIRNFISATAGAFQIGEDRTRVGVVQYGDDPRTEFNLNEHLTRPILLKAIGSLPYKGGNSRT